MEDSRLAQLVNRAITKTISPQEREELLALLADRANKAEAKKLFRQVWDAADLSQTVFTEEQGIDMLQTVLGKEGQGSPGAKGSGFVRFFGKRLTQVAAVFFLAIGGWLIYHFHTTSIEELTLAEAAEHYGIQPGKDRALLTLADGSVLDLDSIQNGLLVEDTGVRIRKAADGQLQYEVDGQVSAPTAYNTVSTPKGGQYRLLLPDGTFVHLNAESSLRYPVRFGDTREVELEGEGYFEVVADRQRAFFVKTAMQTTKVLGTSFNVSAYAGEVTKTTLAEGAVEVSNPTGESVTLSPGQAASNDESEMALSIGMANMDADLAWHHGYFFFRNENIQSIMQRVARWYDIDVEFEGRMQHKDFGGVFQRSKSIDQLLESFRETGLIDFKISGRRVVVMAK